MQAAVFCVSFALSEVFIAESLYVGEKKNNQWSQKPVWHCSAKSRVKCRSMGKGKWGEQGSCEDDQDEKQLHSDLMR